MGFVEEAAEDEAEGDWRVVSGVVRRYSRMKEGESVEERTPWSKLRCWKRGKAEHGISIKLEITSAFQVLEGATTEIASPKTLLSWAVLSYSPNLTTPASVK